MGVPTFLLHTTTKPSAIVKSDGFLCSFEAGRLLGCPQTTADKGLQSNESYESLEVSNCRLRFAAIQISIGSQRFDIARFKSQPPKSVRIAVMMFFFHIFSFFPSNRAIQSIQIATPKIRSNRCDDVFLFFFFLKSRNSIP